MIRLFLVAFTFWFGLFTDAFSAPTPYSKKVGQWNVGYYSKKDTHAVCMATIWGKNNSAFSIVKDLEDSELYILMDWHEWNISDPVGSESQVSVRLWDEDRTSMMVLNLIVLRPTGIVFRNLSRGIMGTIATHDILEFLMPGTVPDVKININRKDAINMILAFTECIRVSPKKGGVGI